MAKPQENKRARKPSFASLFPRRDIHPQTQASTPRSTAHAAAVAARSSLNVLIKDLRAQERQVTSLARALEEERVQHATHLEDREAAHAKELAAVNETHSLQLAEVEVRHDRELTRVRMWCVMNEPRPNELARVLERQRWSALQAELDKTREQAERGHQRDKARIEELECENDKLKCLLADMQRDSRWK